MSQTRSRGTRTDKMVTCARCGMLRKVTRKTVVLCSDCRYVLPVSEQALWNRAA